MRPTSDEIRLELERILASEPFANTNRLSRFLTFVVERTLAGESEGLKEFVIGVEVFDRDAEYDPRIDSIVRVEAGRLRSKIEEYYRRDGRDDPIVISIEKGGYAPAFERRAAGLPSGPQPSAAASIPAVGADAKRPRARNAGLALAGLAALLIAALVVAAVWREGTETKPPVAVGRIAVLPFSPYSGEPADDILATRLTEGVTAELVRLGSRPVVSSTSARELASSGASLREIARALDAETVMEARILAAGERLRVEARLVDSLSMQKVWVEGFEAEVRDLERLGREIASAADAAAAGQRPRRRAER